MFRDIYNSRAAHAESPGADVLLRNQSEENKIACDLVKESDAKGSSGPFFCLDLTRLCSHRREIYPFFASCVVRGVIYASSGFDVPPKASK